MNRRSGRWRAVSKLALASLGLLTACEHPPQKVDTVPELVQSQANEQAPSKSDDQPDIQPETLANPTAFVSRVLEPVDCSTASAAPLFNPKHIDPPFSARHETASLKAFSDGLVRVRFPVKLPLKNQLTLRAGTPGELRLVFDGASARLGDGPKQPIYKAERTRQFEVLVWLFGPDVVVQIHDARTGLELLTLHRGGLTPASGEVVWQGQKARISARTACADRPPSDLDANPLPRFFDAPETYATKTGLKPVLEGDSAVQTTSTGLEDAFCAGIALSNLRVEPPWSFLDPDFATYRDLPPVEVDGRLRLDLSYKSPEMSQALLHELHRRFPQKTRLEQIGTSWRGRPILALAVANNLRANDPRPTIFLNGAIHGDEPLAAEVVFDALDQLLQGDDPRLEDWLDRFVFWLVPVVNPDGLNEFLSHSRFTGRKNARDLDGNQRIDKREGVDLNRNFPVAWGTMQHEDIDEPFGKWFRGPSPASEPETQALMALAERERFVAALSFHTGTSAVLGAYSVDSLRWLEPDESEQLAQQVSDAMGIGPDGRPFRFRRNLYAVEGVDQDWMRLTHGTLALLIEVARTTPTGWCARTRAVEPGRRAWMAVVDALSSGGLVTGQAVDGQGAPLTVPVALGDQQAFNGESWTTRPRDGRFFRWITTPTATLKVGSRDLSLTLPVKDELKVVLP